MALESIERPDQGIDEIQNIIDRYNSVGLPKRNIEFFTNWTYNMTKEYFYLPCIDDNYIDILAKDKAKLAVFVVLVDDLADNPKIRNQQRLRKALNVPRTEKKDYNDKYIQVAQDIWDKAKGSIQNYPRYRELQEVFHLDIDRFLNGIFYGYVSNRIELSNQYENRKYQPSSMMIKPYLDLDLMCSNKINESIIKELRPIFFHAEDICHIGNVLSTWRREIEEKDYSSPLISLGINKGLINKKEIKNNPRKAKRKLEDLEKEILEIAENDFKEIKKHAEDIDQIDIYEFYHDLRSVFHQLSNRKKYWKDK